MLLVLFLFQVVTSEECLTNWTFGDKVIPWSNPQNIGVGYNSKKNVVYLMGNERSKILKFDMNVTNFSEIDIGTNIKPIIYPSSYTQIDNVLYYYYNGYIYSFDMENETLLLYSSIHPRNLTNLCMVTDGFRFYTLSQQWFYIYHIKYGNWTQEVNIPVSNNNGGCILYNNKLYSLLSNTTNTVYYIDIKSPNQWIAGPTFNSANLYPYRASVLAGSLVYIFAGNNESDIIITFNAVSNEFNTHTAGKTPALNTLTSVIYINGKIYCFGGKYTNKYYYSNALIVVKWTKGVGGNTDVGTGHGFAGYSGTNNKLYWFSQTTASFYDLSIWFKSTTLFSKLPGNVKFLAQGYTQLKETIYFLYDKYIYYADLQNIDNISKFGVLTQITYDGYWDTRYSCLASDGTTFYITGAIGLYELSEEFHYYNTNANLWYKGNNMNMKHSRHTCGYISNKLYVFGGDGASVIESIDVLPIKNNSLSLNEWNIVNTFPNNERCYGRSVLIGNEFYIICGLNYNIYGVSDVVYIYNTVTNSFRTGDKILEPDYGMALIIGNGKLYYMDGHMNPDNWYYSNNICTFNSNKQTLSPTSNPTKQTSTTVSVSPTEHTINPTNIPTISSNIPTITPTVLPSFNPSQFPTNIPTYTPTYLQTVYLSGSPTDYPSKLITETPSYIPSTSPTVYPSTSPTKFPTVILTNTPSNIPTITSTFSPTVYPSTLPTTTPSYKPTTTPTVIPTLNSTRFPTNTPTHIPIYLPTVNPSKSPIKNPSVTPTNHPSNTSSKVPTNVPTLAPEYTPTVYPSTSPTKDPSVTPTNSPSNVPTITPTSSPTIYPSTIPTIINTDNTIDGSQNNGANQLNSISLFDSPYLWIIILLIIIICCCFIIMILFIKKRSKKKKKYAEIESIKYKSEQTSSIDNIEVQNLTQNNSIDDIIAPVDSIASIATHNGERKNNNSNNVN